MPYSVPDPSQAYSEDIKRLTAADSHLQWPSNREVLERCDRKVYSSKNPL